MPRAKVDPSITIIQLFMRLPLGEAGLLLKHLSAVVEGQLRAAANGEAPKKRVAKPKPVAVAPTTFAPEQVAAAKAPRRRAYTPPPPDEVEG